MEIKFNEPTTHRDKGPKHRLSWQSVSLTIFSSSSAKGLLTLLTNLLTCSKCFVISVAKTMSIIAWRSVQ